MEILLYAVAATFIVSIVSLAGIALLLIKKEIIDTYVFFLVAFSAGVLLGDAFIHLLPEAFAAMPEIPLISFTAGGFIYIAATDLLPELHTKKKISLYTQLYLHLGF